MRYLKRTSNALAFGLGWSIIAKYRAQQIARGTFQAARNMRKQGFSLQTARQVLLFTR